MSRDSVLVAVALLVFAVGSVAWALITATRVVAGASDVFDVQGDDATDDASASPMPTLVTPGEAWELECWLAKDVPAGGAR